MVADSGSREAGDQDQNVVIRPSLLSSFLCAWGDRAVGFNFAAERWKDQGLYFLAIRKQWHLGAMA